jgi:hypothetical protein
MKITINTEVEGPLTEESIRFELDDGRAVCVEFVQTNSGTRVIETFEAEDENSADQQKQGWQNILNNFKKYVESKRGFA